jgi:hypothetical protein
MFWKLLVAIGTIRATLALEIHLHHRLLVIPASVSSEADVAVPQYSYKGTINLDSTPGMDIFDILVATPLTN